MRSSLRNLLVLVAVVALAACTAAVALGAATTKAPTRIRFNKAVEFRGRVLSRQHACERSRVLEIYKVKEGDDRLIGTPLSGHHGGWTYPLEPKPSGTFYVKADRVRIRSDEGALVCRNHISAKRSFNP
jgi:hypothetical protein